MVGYNDCVTVAQEMDIDEGQDSEPTIYDIIADAYDRAHLEPRIIKWPDRKDDPVL